MQLRRQDFQPDGGRVRVHENHELRQKVVYGLSNGTFSMTLNDP